jgi:hypothetical protein
LPIVYVPQVFWSSQNTVHVAIHVLSIFNSGVLVVPEHHLATVFKTGL